MEKTTEDGLIFKIKRFCVHDGPGIRTTVFLKGCPLKCIWCHSPEGISKDISIWYDNNACIACGSCVEACSQEALKLEINSITIDRVKCVTAGDCVKICPADALTFTGSLLTADEVLFEIKKDQVFYMSSGGGVTLSGGEPLFQADFSTAILKKCKSENIHTAIETSLYCDADVLKSVMEYIDLFIVDMKFSDPGLHMTFTGRSDENIKKNFLYLAGQGKQIIVRVPLIPNITDTEENRRSIEKFVRKAGNWIPIEFISYNTLAGNNYDRLGIPFPLK